MESVEKIVVTMSRYPNITAQKLAALMQLKPLTIRYHLTNLMAQQMVVCVGEVHTGRSGRPAYSYMLTTKGRLHAQKLILTHGGREPTQRTA